MSDTTPPQGPGPYVYAPPPKKKHTVRNVLLVLVGLCVAGVAGCAALLGSAVESIDDEAKHDKPSEVVEGKAFEHDIWKVRRGWQVTSDGLGGVTIKGMRAKLTGDSADTAMFTIQLNRGHDVLASLDCTGSEVEPGQSAPLSCFSADDMPKKWGSVTVQDSW